MGFSLKKLATGIPVIGGAFDDSDEKAMEMLEQNRELYAGMQLPEFAKYNPEAYQYQGDLNPELAQYQTISEDPKIRSAQLAALQKMSGLAETGLSDVDAYGFDQARQLAQREAKAGTEAAIQNARARGVAGSGMEFAMREMANQEGAGRAQQAALSQAAESARQRALYNQAYMQGMGDLRGQDFSANQANANIINQFNQMNTQAKNAAQERNLGARQQNANLNTAGRNDAFQYNQQMQQQNFNNQKARIDGMAGANTGAAKGYYAENAANQSNRNANTDLLIKAGSKAFGG